MKRYVFLLFTSFMALQSADNDTNLQFNPDVRDGIVYSLAAVGVGSILYNARDVISSIPFPIKFAATCFSVYTGGIMIKDRMREQQNLKKNSEAISSLEIKNQKLIKELEVSKQVNRELTTTNKELSQAVNDGISGLRTEIRATSSRTVFGLVKLWLEDIKNAQTSLGGQLVLLNASLSGTAGRDNAIQQHEQRLSELENAQQNAQALLNQEAFLREETSGRFGISRISVGFTQSSNTIDYSIDEVD